MTEDLLKKINKELGKWDFPEDMRSGFIEKTKHFKKGNFLYPSILKRIPLSTKTLKSRTWKDLLEVLKNAGIVKISYAPYCYNCERYIGESFDSKEEMDKEEIICDECDTELGCFNHRSYKEMYKFI